jgi:hypothetical protein
MLDYDKAHLLGAGLQWNRRTLLVDDCENAARWIKTGNAGDYSVNRVGGAGWFGYYGMDVRTRATGATLGDWAESFQMLGFPIGKVVVVRARLGIPNRAVTEQNEMEFECVDGANSCRFGLGYSVGADTGRYLGAGGTYVDVADLAMVIVNQARVLFEMVVDVEAGVYGRVTLNGVEVDLRGVAGVVDDLSGWKGTRFLVRTTTDGSAQSVLWYDEVYVGEYLDV